VPESAAAATVAHAPATPSRQRVLDLFTAPRVSARHALSTVDWLIFALYATLVAIAIHHHLPSDDEAQAWLLARDNPLLTLLFRRMHYEGAPGLWPILLWVLAHLHLPFASMQWLAGAFACSGILVFLHFAPFPAIFRRLLPFTFFLQYQYAAIARPYALFPLLLFLLCILFTAQRPRPILFAVVAGLLANLGLHAAMLAGLFALLYLFQIMRDPSKRSVSPRLALASAAAVFLLFLVCSIAVALPAADVVLAGDSTHTTFSGLASLLARITPPERLPAGAPALDPPLDFSPIVFLLGKTLIVGAEAACFPVAENNFLAIVTLLALLGWLSSRRALRFVLPWLVTILLSVQLILLDHHTGQLLLALVAAVWLALGTTQPRPSNSRIAPAQAFGALALLVIILQIGWSLHALSHEADNPYDPGRETAAFLASHLAGKRIDGFAYESVTTQLYAPTRIFQNQPAAYWVWSAPVFIDRRRTEALDTHPDAIVQGVLLTGPESVSNQFHLLTGIGENISQPMLDDWRNHGFRITQRFCGQRFMRAGVANTQCELILQPANPQPAHPQPASTPHESPPQR
jgi:hypothetical protein